MAFRDTWHRTLVYFGLAEDEAYDEEEVEAYQEPEVEVQDTYRERPNVRRLSASAAAMRSTTSSPTTSARSDAPPRCDR